MQEDKKHRDKYESLEDSEKKIQYFSARQIACRVLGSRGYLCQKVYQMMVVSLCSIYLVYVEKSSLSMEQFLCLKLSEFITTADNVNIFLFLPSAGFPRKTVCVQELCHTLFGIVSNSGCICIRRYFLSMLFFLTFVFLWFT